ncbi:antirestriction protein ArdA [Legionella yabuuchiae]|uniref:antirestriction protein ArdA n=1 Tax=Legionella yabuuchiae TaxID=376727 RepID=UPI00105533D3|nr:antirestriction protein ArdA [Legionella yabuuchiae]
MDKPEIYVACLASYNSGYLHGQWIDANQSEDAIMEDIQAMLEDSPVSDPGDWAIHDYQGFGDIEIHEFESISTIADYAEFIAEHEELGQALIADFGFDAAKVMIEDQYHGCYDSEVDFAEQIIDECYCEKLPDNLMAYFDYDAFARDLFINDFCAVELNGYVHVFSNY